MPAASVAFALLFYAATALLVIGLAARGLTPEDLVTEVKVVSSSELAGLMEQQDVVLSF